VSNQHFQYTNDQLDDRPSGTIIVQPIRRETGPAILYPLLHVYQRDPEAIVCLFPSDHFVLNEQTFMEHIEFSSEFVAGNPQSIILLGIKSRHPEGEYGWIVTREYIVDGTKRVYSISRFVEKPDAFTAWQLHQSGSLWNTMVVISKAKTLLNSFKMFSPTLYQAFWEIRNVLGTSRETPVVEEVFSRISSTNFSHSILEKNPSGLQTVTVRGAYWSDWGDAARIQSDIKHFCAPRQGETLPMSFSNISDATVLVPEEHESI
jgi:mannose-1-phosphate guanylyltransferase